uniref:RFX1-4/6/8-like BCD domain-containing protein n=1 Tax=Romanomermis culicivorax TaxID=13658 RepID=A0A915HJ97_ROMCU
MSTVIAAASLIWIIKPYFLFSVSLRYFNKSCVHSRGNSKYHYYGIRIKPDSPLNRISEDSLTMAMRQQPTNAARRAKLQMSQCPASPTSVTSIQSNAVSVISRANGIQSQQHNLQATQPQLHLQQQQNFVEANAAVPATEILISGSNVNGTVATPDVAPPGGNENFVLNTVIPEVARPSLACLEPQLERVGLTVGHAELFFMNYRNHCEELFDCVRNQLFGEVDKCWRRFWQVTDNGSVDSYDDESNDAMNDDGLNRTQLYTLCIMPEILKYIQSMDFQYYQVMVNVLIPNVLKPIPNSLTQSMRSFAKRLESNLAEILQGAPEVVVRLDAISTLAQAFRRYTSLNHLAQTVRGVLQNSNHISQMLADLNRVDFRNVHEQASWVCYCDPVKVDEIERSFKSALQSQKNLEHLADWSNSIVNQLLAEYCDKPVVQLIHISRQFLLKWCFYRWYCYLALSFIIFNNSLVMRDLTLRSATSFGSFHLIRLLLDEYMFYLVEQLVSRTEQQTTLAIMSQVLFPIHFEMIDSIRSQLNFYSKLWKAR